MARPVAPAIIVHNARELVSMLELLRWGIEPGGAFGSVLRKTPTHDLMVLRDLVRCLNDLIKAPERSDAATLLLSAILRTREVLLHLQRELRHTERHPSWIWLFSATRRQPRPSSTVETSGVTTALARFIENLQQTHNALSAAWLLHR